MRPSNLAFGGVIVDDLGHDVAALRMWMSVLPRTIRWYWFQSLGLMKALRSSGVPRSAMTVGPVASTWVTWPRTAR